MINLTLYGIGSLLVIPLLSNKLTVNELSSLTIKLPVADLFLMDISILSLIKLILADSKILFDSKLISI